MATGGLARSLRRACRLDTRATESEMMDTRHLPEPVVHQTLRFLALTNRRFGGAAVVVRHLARFIRHWPPERPIRVLDVGTGGADIPCRLVEWARLRRFALEVTAIDSAPDIVEAARARAHDVPEIVVQEADLFQLAESGARFDYVVASMVLHHMPPSRTPQALLALDRLAVRGVIVSDLLRAPSAFLAVWALSRLAGNAVVRHDGPLSVQRGFTVGELTRLAADVGLPHLEARRERWFRVSLARSQRIVWI